MRPLILLLAFLVCDITQARDSGAKARGEVHCFQIKQKKRHGFPRYRAAPIAVINNLLINHWHPR